MRRRRGRGRAAKYAPGTPLGGRLNKAFTFDSFVEGKSNQLARAAAFQVAQNPGSAYNPLFIYGGVGLGKTHLMHAIGNQILARNPAAKVAYVHSERFVSDMVRGLQHNTIAEFKRSYRSLDALLIDDIQFFAGKDRSQEEFFHTFNALLEGQRQIILTCDRYPKEVAGLEERLKSRFGWGLTVAIEQPELETSVAILMSKAAAEGETLPEEVAFFLAQRIRSNVRELEGALAPGARELAVHGSADHARVRQGSAARRARAAREARDGREHPKDRRGVFQNQSRRLIVETAQPVDRAAAANRHGAREGADDAQPSGDRRRVRRSRPHDRAACVPAHQGAAGDGDEGCGGLQQPVENPDDIA